ncbi:hypothetical protein Taro_010212 [Colocasia esculenta]|uniref:Ethylene insensitive 3-like DNA-binding domain-containing protein n=1 Tax=Colocasia esculenta TaxID=4460 RepID=A0A843U7P6_COLES|nr:hypothetical protein [Colocasia esculenta]
MGGVVVDDIGFPSSYEFWSLPPSASVENLQFASMTAPQASVGSADVMGSTAENFNESIPEDDDSEEDIDVDELERRMWRDRLRLKRLKEQQQNKSKEQGDAVKQRQSQEQARRKKMSRAQDGILKYMLKMMEVCKAQGFVYGIIPEKGKPVSGASDNLRAWWKEKVRFDRNGPAAIAKYQADNAIPGSGGSSGTFSYGSTTSEYDVDGFDDVTNIGMGDSKMDGSLFNIGAVTGKEKPLGTHTIKEEVGVEFIQKRPPTSDVEQMVKQNTFTCENIQCPHHDHRFGFLDKNARNNHQYACHYRSNFSQRLGGSGFQLNEDKPQAFSLPFVQPKPAQFSSSHGAVDISALGIPADGQKSICELMSFYDNNINPNKQLDGGALNVVDDPNPLHPRMQMDDNFFGQALGIEATNMFEESNTSMQTNACLRDDINFQQGFENQHGDVSADFRYTSFNFSNMEYGDGLHRVTGDSMSKLNGSNWPF